MGYMVRHDKSSATDSTKEMIKRYKKLIDNASNWKHIDSIVSDMETELKQLNEFDQQKAKVQKSITDYAWKYHPDNPKRIELKSNQSKKVKKADNDEPVRWVTIRGKHFPVYLDEKGNEYFGVGKENRKGN